MLTAEEVSDLREAKGLRQDQLAALVGVSKNTVSNWETGRTRPTRYMGKLRRILLAPDGSLGTPDPPSGPLSGAEPLPRDVIAAALRQATDTDLLAEVARRFTATS